MRRKRVGLVFSFINFLVQMTCGRKDSQKVAGLKPEHQENYALAFQGQGRALN
jgi:hypothetical protein